MFLTSWIKAIGFWAAQVPEQPIFRVIEETPIVFSGAQFLTVLVAGVILAFAFQLVLTNLGVAAGISLSGGSSSHNNNDEDKENTKGFKSTISQISTVVGLGTLISVTLALFFACLLAIKLGMFVPPLLAAIMGLVIWGTYFSLLVWVSSTTVGSLIGSVVNTATSGFQTLMGTATAAIGTQATSKKAVDTAEAMVAKVRKEIGEAIDPVSLRENIEDYLSSLKPQPLNLDKLGTDLETIINEEDLEAISDSEYLPTLTRQTFVKLLDERSDLSRREINRIADQLENVWQKITTKASRRQDSFSELTEYIKSATAEELLGNQFTDKLERLMDTITKSRESQSPNLLAHSLTMGINSLISIAMGRSDLSKLDIDQIVDKITQAKSQLERQTHKLIDSNGNGNGNHLQSKINNYLLNAHPDNLQREHLHQEFRYLLYNSEQDPEVVAQELQEIDRSDFVSLLSKKGILTQEKIENTADILEKSRLEVISTAQGAIEQEKRLVLLARIQEYLWNTPREDLLNREKVQISYKPILNDHQADTEQLKERLSHFDTNTLERLLERRDDLTVKERILVLSQLEDVRKRVLKESEDNQAAIQGKIDEQWFKLQAYLQDTDKEELNPHAISHELQLLLDNPQVGINLLRERVSRFDRDTLVQLLNQREDLTESQINQIIDQVEKIWSVPTQLSDKLQEKYHQISSDIAEYLRNTEKSELNPEGIQRDLGKLLNQPGAGIKAIKHRLSMMDRDTLVQLLSQRQDFSEAEVNEIIDQILNTIQSMVTAPQLLAAFATTKVQKFPEALANYLRSTGKEELHPEGIKRDLQLLLNNPQAGMESLQERLAYFDRETLVALLSERHDISREDVERIVDQILAVRDQVTEKIDYVKNRIHAAINRILYKIRRYLNGLERPELNYYGIRDDIHQLLDDPQAGFAALRDRFSHLNRDTIVAILSSRDDLSAQEAEGIVAQVEHTRDRLLQRAERIEQAAKLRLEQVKQEAEKQASATKKAAATAAWWLFFTALISAVASAGAGVIAVT